MEIIGSPGAKMTVFFPPAREYFNLKGAAMGREVDDDCSGGLPAVELPVDGTLDLHFFRPRDVGELVPDYIAECRRRGILQVRIVHGKGRGALRAKVHAVLSRVEGVRDFSLAGEDGGGWGATLVRLSPLDGGSRESGR